MCDISQMRRILTAVSLLCVLPAFALAQSNQRAYKWVDENGVVHYGDTIPVDAAELEKHIVNDAGVTVDVMRGKATPEELAAERRQLELEQQQELKRRADAALLATYLSIEEIIMHRDRRVELFQAQARVTELYLRNLKRRLDSLQTMAENFRPYSTDPDAEMIDPGLTEDINATKQTIARHEDNLNRFRPRRARDGIAIQRRYRSLQRTQGFELSRNRTGRAALNRCRNARTRLRPVRFEQTLPLRRTSPVRPVQKPSAQYVRPAQSCKPSGFCSSTKYTPGP